MPRPFYKRVITGYLDLMDLERSEVKKQKEIEDSIAKQKMNETQEGGLNEVIFGKDNIFVREYGLTEQQQTDLLKGVYNTPKERVDRLGDQLLDIGAALAVLYKKTPEPITKGVLAGGTVSSKAAGYSLKTYATFYHNIRNQANKVDAMIQSYTAKINKFLYEEEYTEDLKQNKADLIAARNSMIQAQKEIQGLGKKASKYLENLGKGDIDYADATKAYSAFGDAQYISGQNVAKMVKEPTIQEQLADIATVYTGVVSAGNLLNENFTIGGVPLDVYFNTKEQTATDPYITNIRHAIEEPEPEPIKEEVKPTPKPRKPRKPKEVKEEKI